MVNNLRLLLTFGSLCVVGSITGEGHVVGRQNKGGDEGEGPVRDGNDEALVAVDSNMPI